MKVNVIADSSRVIYPHKNIEYQRPVSIDRKNMIKKNFNGIGDINNLSRYINKGI